MTGPDDGSGGTDRGATLDAVVERCLRGQMTGDGPASLAAFLADVRVATGGPPPTPSVALEALLSGAEAPHEAPAGRRGTLAEGAPRRRRRLRRGPVVGPARRAPGVRLARRVAAAGLAGKVMLALALAGTAAAGAGAAGVLPDAVDAVVRRVVELVTPFELPKDASAHLVGDDSARPTAVGPGHAHPAGAARAPAVPGTTADRVTGETGESPTSDPVAGASAPVSDEDPAAVAAPGATQTGQPAPPSTLTPPTSSTAAEPLQTQLPVTGAVTAGSGDTGSGGQGAGAGGPVAGSPHTIPAHGPGSDGAVPDSPASASRPPGQPTGSAAGSGGPGPGSGSHGPGPGSEPGSRGPNSGSEPGSHGPGSGSPTREGAPGSVSGSRGPGAGSAPASRGPDGGSEPPMPGSHRGAPNPASHGPAGSPPAAAGGPG